MALVALDGRLNQVAVGATVRGDNVPPLQLQKAKTMEELLQLNKDLETSEVINQSWALGPILIFCVMESASFPLSISRTLLR